MNYDTIIETIIEQFSGSIRRLQLNIGAYGFIKGETDDKPYLQFSFKLCPKANKCRISYHYGKDTYIVEFYKYNSKTLKCPLVATFDNVYCDTLTSTFEEYTGLAINYYPVFV